jgi:wyosine [tRNA(Phe)-imidazoG37] synthetase (radical SAM superfamily)
MEIEPHVFYDPVRVISEVRNKVGKSRDAGEEIDYLTFVPDGEPTLDAGLGAVIDGLKPMGIRIGVITNASLVPRKDVQKGLLQADWVSLKIDSVQPDTWRRINRPHRGLDLEDILDGACAVAEDFSGELVTETMLVRDLNDAEADAASIADFVSVLKPRNAYISIPTRPPAEQWVHAPEEDVINRFFQVVSGGVPHVEYLIGYEGNAFAWTGDTREDLLSITAVHPMRQDAVEEFLTRAGEGWDVVEALKAEGRLVTAEYEGNRYFVRSLPGRRGAQADKNRSSDPE